MRVATYTRISTDEEHQPYSLEAQADRLDSYVASQDGWERVRTSPTRHPVRPSSVRRCSAPSPKPTRDASTCCSCTASTGLARSVRGLAQILEELDSRGWPSAPPPSPSTPRRLRAG